MKALPLSPKISFLRPGDRVYISASFGLREMTLRSINPIGRHFAVSFQGVDDRESASRYRDSLIEVSRQTIPLEQGEFFYDQLIGLTVITTDGQVIGEVKDIIETGSNDVYVVKGTGREYLVPAIRDVVKEIDTEGRKVLIEVMEGMLD
jgi:16S rRNA processing protein RimM